jgi:RHS repeat-associated protein
MGLRKQHLAATTLMMLAIIAPLKAHGACTSTLQAWTDQAKIYIHATADTPTCNWPKIDYTIDNVFHQGAKCDRYEGPRTCSVTAEHSTIGRCAGDRLITAIAGCVSSTNGTCEGPTTTTKVVTLTPAPTVNVSVTGPSATGVVSATITYTLPRTNPGAGTVESWLQSPTGQKLSFGTFHPGTSSGSTVRTFNTACFRPGGNYTVHARAIPQCISDVVQASAAVTVPPPRPTVGVTIDTAVPASPKAIIAYSFPQTAGSAERALRLEWTADGALIAAPGSLTTTGTATVALPACTPGRTRIRAIATACGDSAYRDIDEVERPEATPIVTIAIVKTGVSGDNRPIIEATLGWNFKGPTGKIGLDRLVWEDAAGNVWPAASLRPLATAPTPSGTEVFTFLAPSAGKQLRVRATAEACVTRTVDTATDCDACAASLDPVFFNDGNMQLTDNEPLPPIAGLDLTRTYNSDEQVVGLFGRGWTTFFEQRLVADANTVSIASPTGDITTFSRTGSVFVQTWPLARAAADVLTYDGAAGTYAHRRTGSTRMTIFGSDGRLVAIRDSSNGRQATVTRDATGLPQALTDSWSGVAWNLTITQRRVNTISVSGRPDLTWTYTYDSAGNLEFVVGPGNVTWRTYEYVSNRMTASYDAVGNIIEAHTYDGNGVATSSTGPSDEIAGIQYNLAGSTALERITRVTYKNGAMADYTLRPSGGTWRPVRIAGGCATCGAHDATYVRDLSGRVIREQGGDGYITARTYDATGRVLTTEHALKPATCDPATDTLHCRLDPDALASATLASTTASAITAYEYADPLWPDRVTVTVRPSVHKPGDVRRESYTFHPATGVITSTTVSGWTGQPPAQAQRTTQVAFYGDIDLAAAFTPGGSFDSAWLLLPQPYGLRRAVDGPRSDVQDVTSFVYYPIDPTVPALLRGHLAAAKGASGLTIHYEAYDVFGNATRIVDANGVATEMVADVLGRPSTSTIKGVSGCDTSVDALCATDLATTRTYASVAGPLQTEHRPGGGVTSHTYDARGRVHTVSRGPSATDLRERIEYTYDPLTGKKNLEKTLAWESGSWVEKRRDAFGYDAEGRLQTVTHPDATTVTYTYDADDRLKTMKDERHTTANAIYEYDPAGRLASVKQLLSAAAGTWITTSYAYDTAGNLTSVTDPNGNATTYAYDDFGHMLSQTSPVTGTTTYAYDDAGNLTLTTDATAASTARTYDALARVLTATSTRSGSTTEAVTWGYDDTTAGRYSVGRLSSMTDPAGSTSYSYDRRGLLRHEARTTLTQETFNTRFQYSADGERTAVTYPSGAVLTYAHDHAGRPISATMPGRTLVTSASYLPFGPAARIVYGNGTEQAMQYDARYQMLENKLTTASGTIAEYDYASDGSGNVTGIADAVDPGYSRTFAYDDLNRLTVANTGMALWRTGSYSYDAMGNMLSWKLGDGESVERQEAHFTYVGTTPLVATVRNNNIVDTGDNLSRRNRSRVQPNAVGYHTVSYDAAGNEVSYVATRGYSGRNLLAFVAERVEPGSPAHRLEYEYDGRGIRVTRRDTWGTAATTTRYIYSPELQLLASTGSTGAIRHEFLWFDGRPLAQLSTAFTGPRWYFNDHLGTPILQTDQNAATAWRVEYEPYGDIYRTRAPEWTEQSPITTADQPLRFPGQEAAMNWEGTEERYNIFRWYRSGWGRYTQSDPMGLRAGINLFVYANGNPVTTIDPLGLKAELVCKAVGTGGIPIPGSKHCRIRVTCEQCGAAPIDVTVGMEFTGNPPYSMKEWPYPQGLQNYDTTVPIGVDGKDECNFTKCIRAYNKLFGEGYTGQDTKWVPKYSIPGPNSNTYAQQLLTACDGWTVFPPGAIGSGGYPGTSTWGY